MAAQASNQTTQPINHCMPVECAKCGKTTWRGCGRHVDQVMKTIPEEQRCACPRD